MRRILVPAIVIVMLMVGGLLSAASLPSPVDAAAQATATPPGGFCSEEELARGENIVRVPGSHPDGEVTPFNPNVQDMVLYLVVLTLPPDSCLEYRHREGALVMVVQEGTIVYNAHAFAAPGVVIEKGDSDGSAADNVDVVLDTPVTLHANEWLTQDQEVWFTFRNSGDENAVVSVAVYAHDPWSQSPCSGGCKAP